MHTILGANGIIGEGLAKELYLNYEAKPKLEGRTQKKVTALYSTILLTSS